MLTADSVSINRLFVKGEKHTSQALVRELEQTSWAMPLPAHLQQAWILVRELKITGKARDLRQQTARQLDAQLHGAVRGVHGNAAAANVVWFASFPELLAFLLVDLALGKATQWYWSRWTYLLNYPKHEAIARLLCEHCEHLPAVVIQLQSRQQLSLVWSQLSDDAAKTIVRELIRVGGLPSVNTWESDCSVTSGRAETIRQVLQSHTALLRYWRPILKGLTAQDGRVLLATAVHGLTYTPLWLQHQPNELVRVFAGIVCKLTTGISAAVAVENSAEFSSPKNTVSQQEVSPHSDQMTTLQPESDLFRQDFPLATTHSANASKTETPMGDRPSVIENKSHVELASLSHQKLAGLVSASAQYAADDVGSLASSDLLEAFEFTTRAGGFFYLLNPLHRLLTTQQLAAQTDASAWYWLLDLYRVFAQNFPALNDLMDTPLQRFILQQLHPGATSTELQECALAVLSTPVSDFSLALFADLRKQVVHTGFWQELTTSPGFFATPARVIATASHWDIYFPLQAVRLDLRLAAWDINPGWLPWLGRVVSLHYVDTSQLESVGSDHYEP